MNEIKSGLRLDIQSTLFKLNLVKWKLKREREKKKNKRKQIN